MLKTREKTIPTCSNHEQTEVIKALASFGDQDNPRADLECFSNNLLDFLYPNRKTDPNEQRVYDVLQEIYDKVKNSREFSKTYLGHMLSQPCTPALWGDALGSRLDGNTVARQVSLKESELEPIAMNGLMDLVGYQYGEASGTFTSGGSVANMTAFAVARKLMEKEYENKGQKVPNEVWVLTTSLAHYSVDKSLNLLGGLNHQIKKIDVNTRGMKMSITDLELKIEEAKQKGIPIMAIMAIAGETETGLVDNLDEIANIAEKYGIYSHCDAAFGGPYIKSRAGSLFKGMNRFRSITLDPHKTLYEPYAAGAVLFKHAEDHAELARGVKANYIQFAQDLPKIIENFKTGKEGSLGAKRIEGSMGPGPILATLAVLNTLGQEGLRVVYDLTLDRIEHLNKRLNESKYLTSYHQPEINLLCFTLKEEVAKELGMDVHDEGCQEFIANTILILDNNIEGKGGYFFSETDLPDESQVGPNKKNVWTWRACIMNPWTTDEIVDSAIDNLEHLIEVKLDIKKSCLDMLTR